MYIKKKLFNWLGSNLLEKNCLDLFAGSGSLGFEAASRYSNYVTLLEKNKLIFDNLINIKSKLFANNINILNIDAIDYIKNFKFKLYDILFIDPPYKSLDTLIYSLKLSFSILNPKSFIFIESKLNLNILYDYFIAYLSIIKGCKVGNRNLALFKFK